MTINKYIPPVNKVKDWRNERGGYYEATCNVCGTVYYPKRSNSIYCNPKCAVTAQRKRNAEILANGGTVKKREPKKPDYASEIEKLKKQINPALQAGDFSKVQQINDAIKGLKLMLKYDK